MSDVHIVALIDVILWRSAAQHTSRLILIAGSIGSARTHRPVREPADIRASGKIVTVENRRTDVMINDPPRPSDGRSHVSACVPTYVVTGIVSLRGLPYRRRFNTRPQKSCK